MTESSSFREDATSPTRGTLIDYLRIARFDHCTKHVLIVPGVALAYVLRGVHVESLALSVVAGLAAAVFVASGNYVINEWLDRHYDRFHPTKSQRPAVRKSLRRGYVVAEWLILLAAGFACALAASSTMFAVAVLFAIQGVVYNIRPFRTKDLPYLDVISESVNNPLRLMIGWAMVDPTTLPPGSILLAYWTGGAFLMAAKRLSEYREIVAAHGKDLLASYRRSFAGYSEPSLAAACLAYALLSVFFLAVFLVKYRIEYLLVAPLVVALFSYYLALSMQPGSSAQRPERLIRERGLIFLVVLLAGAFLLLTVVNVPVLDGLVGQRYITIP
ncbi:4-hydroxybenzoate polyprenyltransferase [Enhydrobacter aerosaccus]|uniref:4-hydroxybenzoate polyprenyltransferase n=1 Tax=Enhydrobacter aerosaccus TaxID=225324 RepID=A0A1T4TEP3_9HYPH|nr:UbiA family prenyltransferase [Enhydrobacter aerosaccus]SKA38708.1 4-hydroxybenzoate polyprenyltransferase [Enhydrobacter aerosaccus]